MSDPNVTVGYRPDAAAGGSQAPPPTHVGRYRVERVLGRGGFGVVFLAHDDQLQRPVAVKVPHPKLVARTADADAYLTEARAAAKLDHPHIVPVYDVGATDQFPCFVVSKYVDGSDLASRLRQGRLTRPEAVGLAAAVADALHHAHTHGLVHRDVKPGNLLLDRTGKAFVADFGLALREQDVGKGPGYAGTPAYMSPEQARGEGHRVDGRSDVFSLGVVLYELLAGRPPFRGDSVGELLEQVATLEPRPLRQLDETIPRELERICLKALAKRASERHLTARDLADDLRHFLAAAAPDTRPPAPAATADPPAPPPGSDPRPAAVLPKGLRSFDAADADFFLDLLPGPRDRDGLPDALRFWKTRIEQSDADATFAVGLIYGPSGCGKSSLVKAGLLPRLQKAVAAVYVEATAEQTEARLLKGLRRVVPDLPPELGLTESLAAMRRGRCLAAGRKVLLVLDQFEQWLHARRHDETAELVRALRQCDGGRVQAVVMVRDDFWMAATGFLRAVEVALREGENSAAVDLFPVRHAERVLTAFGRAFGELPAAGEPGKEQKLFVEQAVAGLAQDGKVIPVRLALFAEMVKGRAWTPATLKAVGGASGVGVAFLDETFTASTAPPPHRFHQKAAQSVLRALLPAADTDLKGHMRSERELREASGYAARPKDFDDLLRILDGDLRLITPTDPEGKDAPAPSGERFYQLTHDFLVPSLREWLTRKQKETRRGRAALLLADRAAVWAARPENRQLPSLWQWLGLRVLTKKRNWTPPERAMMRRAGRHHAVRTAAVLVVLTLLGLLGWEGNGRLKAQTLRDRLMESTTADAPAVVNEMASYRRWCDPLLREAYTKAEAEQDRRRQLHASLGLLPTDPSQVDYLYERMLTGDPAEVVVIREALAGHNGELTERLWAEVANKRHDPYRQLRAACALAAFAPDDPRWEGVSEAVAGTLLVQKPFALAAWTDALKGASRWLLPELRGFLTLNGNLSLSEVGVIASVFGVLVTDQPEGLALLEGYLSDPLIRPETDVGVKIMADVGVALLVMGRGEKVWPLLARRPDPTLRSVLIQSMAGSGVDHKLLLARLDVEKDVNVRRAILLALSQYGLDRVPAAERSLYTPRVLALYRGDPDPGVHAAARTLLGEWGTLEELATLDDGLPVFEPDGKRRWYLTDQEQTLVLVSPPGEFGVGEADEKHRRRIDRPFAIASGEVTTRQFLRFRERHDYNKWYAPSGNCPALFVTWYDAAAYCNWLSEKEGIPKDQWCYLPNKDGKYADGMSVAPDHLKRTGYRLPTEAEWDYCCRAGAGTDYSFGRTMNLLDRYGWYDGDSHGISHPVGTLRPNDLGLFDMHGNAWEWCQDAFRPNPKTADDKLVPDPDGGVVDDKTKRVLRGGSFNNPPPNLRSAVRNAWSPGEVDNAVGFRVARTLPR